VLHAVAAKWPGRVVAMDLQVNSGKAEAVRLGMVRAMSLPKTAYAGFWDADLATPLEAIPTFIEVMNRREDIDLLLGARVGLLGRDIDRKASRHYSGRVFATAASLVLSLPVYDTQCGAKLIRVNPITRSLFDERFGSRWIFDVEMIARYLTHRKSGGIYELPLDQWKDVAGSKVRTIDFVRAIGECLRIYRRYRASRGTRRLLDLIAMPFVRYAGAGVIGTAVHYLTLIAGVELLAMSPTPAAVTGAVFGGIVNYVVNYHFTFASTRSHRQTLPRFTAVAISGAVLSGLTMQVATGRFGLHYLLGQALATVLALGTGYVLNKTWTFTADSELERPLAASNADGSPTQPAPSAAASSHR
jgi:putative flippase GtrA